MKIPTTMHYINTPAKNDPDVMKLTVGPVPKPNSTEVLIRVMAAGVSRGDLSQRKGLYPPPPDASPILGLDVSGEIIAKGAAVTRFNIPDKVCAFTNGG